MATRISAAASSWPTQRSAAATRSLTACSGLVRKHKPMHVSLVGGEPMVRHRELSRILPALSEMGMFTLVVTSGMIPIPTEWMKLPRVRVAISVDGLPEHHDIRRKPATYERILAKYRRPRSQHPLGDHAADARARRATSKNTYSSGARGRK